MAERIELEITLEDGKVVKGFANIQSAAEKAADASGRAFDKSFTGLGSAFKAVGIAAGAAFAAAGLAIGKVLKDGITEAMGAENALNDLKAAFRAQGVDVASAASRMQEFAAGLQKITTVGDDAIIQNAALLVSIGKLKGEGLEKATKAALDLSAGLNIELNSAFELVAKAAAGNAGALGRYGIKIDENLPKSQQFASALDRINQAFGGAAESKVNTYAGALAQLGIRFDDMLEAIGNLVIKSPAVVSIIKLISEEFLKITQGVEAFGSTGDVVGELIKKMLEFGQTIITYVVAPLELLYNISRTVINALAWGVQGIIVFIVALGNAIVNLVITPIQWVLEKLGKLAGLVNGEYRTALENAASALQFLPDATKTALEATGEAWTDVGAKVKDSAGKILDFDVSLAAKNLADKLKETVEQAKAIVGDEPTGGGGGGDGITKILSVGDAFRSVSVGMKTEAESLAKAADKNFRQVGASMLNGIGSAAGQAFGAFGKALATGKNGLEAFINSLLASMGQMAIQLGTQFILTGAAYMWAGLPNGGALMAAGAALATFGGVLAGLGSAKESGGGVATAGGLSSSPSSDMSSLPETETQKPKTDVHINIQGNVLDRRESGMAIIDILNEYFSANDGRTLAVT